MAKKQSGKSASAPLPLSKKTSVAFEPDAYRTLGAAALWTGKDRSEIVNQLIKDHLGKYAVTFEGRKTVDYVKPSVNVDSVNQGSHVESPVAQAS